MARICLDMKHNGNGGELITMCLIRDDNVVFHVGFKESIHIALDAWVQKHVVPVINNCPIPPRWLSREEIQDALARLLSHDGDVTIVTDWPKKLVYFNQLLLKKNGMMLTTAEEMPRITFKVERINAYPTEIPDALRYNAYNDVIAFRHKLDFPNGKGA